MTNAPNVSTSRWFWIGIVLAIVAVSSGATADLICAGGTGWEVCAG